MTEQRFHGFLVKHVNEKIENTIAEAKDCELLMQAVGDNLKLFPNWYLDREEGLYAGWWWKNELTITLPWNEKLLTEKVTELQDLGWKVTTGKFDTPKAERGPSQTSIMITLRHNDISADAVAWSWRYVELRLRMIAKEPDSMAVGQTCYLVEIGEEEVVTKNPIYDLICPESYAELDNKTTESSE